MLDWSYNALSCFALRNPLRKALHFDLMDEGNTPYCQANYAKNEFQPPAFVKESSISLLSVSRWPLAFISAVVDSTSMGIEDHGSVYLSYDFRSASLSQLPNENKK